MSQLDTSSESDNSEVSFSGVDAGLSRVQKSKMTIISDEDDEDDVVLNENTNETDNDNHHTSSMNIVLQSIENNKRSDILGNNAISCPMSSFQTSDDNSQIPDAIRPDQTMSISSDILRLKSFCIHH